MTQQSRIVAQRGWWRVFWDVHNVTWAEPAGGYAILALLVLGALGATLAPGGLRHRARASQRMVAAALLLGAALSLLWPSIRARLTETPASQLAVPPTGAWTYGTDTLSINADGSYQCRGNSCIGLGALGTWHADAAGRLVVRWSDGHEVEWRIVRYNGRDRLGLSPASGSGGTWESGLSFMRVSR